MRIFELIIHAGEPVAAIVPQEITDSQLWSVHRVLCPEDWASAQINKRKQKPKGKKLAFL